ncbi:MAG: tetratricopeptide repeat protein [bacterium]
MRLGWLALAAFLLAGCEPDIDPLATAEAAFRAGDYAAAAADFARALEVAPAAERPGVRARLGQTLKLLGRTDAAEQALQRAIAEADGRGDGDVAARARRYLGRLYADAGRADEAETLYAAAHAWYQAHGPAAELVKVQVNRAGLAWAAQAFDKAWDLYQDVYQRAVALEDARLQANGLDGMAMLLSYVGEFEAARELLDQTARMHTLADRPADAAVAYATQGIVAIAEGDAVEARRLAGQALELGQTTGMQAAVLQARIVLAAAALEVQDWDAALAEADQAATAAAEQKIEPLRQEAEAAALEALAGARRWSALAARADAFRPGTGSCAPGSPPCAPAWPRRGATRPRRAGTCRPPSTSSSACGRCWGWSTSPPASRAPGARRTMASSACWLTPARPRPPCGWWVR